MSSRPLSRRALLAGSGVVAIAGTGVASWRVVARDDHAVTVVTPPVAMAPSGAATPTAGIDPTVHHLADGDSGVAGLYLTITNAGPEPDVLLGGTTVVCQTVEPHAMRMNGDVMAMEYLPDGLPLPAGQRVTLEPDGDHLMLVGLTQNLRPDTTFAVTLTFQRAGPVDLMSAVRWTLDPDPDPDAAGELGAPVTAGDLTIDTVWSRPAPMLASDTDTDTAPATPIADR